MHEHPKGGQPHGAKCRRGLGSARLTFSVLLAEGQQFFVESTDLPRAIYEVNLENPVSLASFRVRSAHTVRIVRVHVQDLTPYPHIGNPAQGQTITSLDWVGRNHGTFKLGNVPNSKGNGVVSGFDLRTTNFLYCDGHVENKNIADTLRPWEWGDQIYSLNQGTDINTN